jgi:polyphosphate kinase
VIFDPSWYNRAGVERVIGFCSEEEATRFFSVVLKWRRPWSTPASCCSSYWLEVSPEEQERRLRLRIDDGRKFWKLSKMDFKSFARWDEYTRVRDEMFEATDTAWEP